MESPTDSDATRVCVCTTAHDTTDSRVVHREAVSLSAAGYDVTYYTPFRGSSPIETVSYADAETGEVPDVRDRLRWAGALARELVTTDYDVYHFHDVELLPVGALLAAVTDGAVVYDVHENVEDVLRHKSIFPAPVRAPLARAASTVESVLSKFVDGIVVASPDVADRFGGPESVAVVTNYPKRQWVEGTTPPARQSRNPDRPVQFVYCGLLSADRGILTVVDAVDRIPDEYDVTLTLGGKYESATARDRIERRVAASDRVESRGWLPTLADVVDLFRESDVGMMCFHPDPNKTGAVHRSNKLFQYMAAGVPIVVSDVGEWARLVEDIGCGVAVDPEDPDAVAAGMVELLDADTRRERAQHGYEAALDRFNWETQRETLLAEYRRLTDGRVRSDERERDLAATFSGES